MNNIGRKYIIYILVAVLGFLLPVSVYASLHVDHHSNGHHSGSDHCDSTRIAQVENDHAQESDSADQHANHCCCHAPQVTAGVPTSTSQQFAGFISEESSCGYRFSVISFFPFLDHLPPIV